jgi:hypothetical protein
VNEVQKLERWLLCISVGCFVACAAIAGVSWPQRAEANSERWRVRCPTLGIDQQGTGQPVQSYNLSGLWTNGRLFMLPNAACVWERLP